MEPDIAKNPVEKGKSGSFLSGVLEWAKVIVLALLISMPIRIFIAEPFIVSGASMDPTFATGQFLIVDRLTYRLDKPSRGDVVVFQYPNDPSTYFIKRIVGLPGETIKIADGIISVTDLSVSEEATILEEPYIDSSHRSHEDLLAILGPNEYFVMGDNRKESSDSRTWGPLDEQRIVGRPIMRLFPVSKLSIFPGEFRSE